MKRQKNNDMKIHESITECTTKCKCGHSVVQRAKTKESICSYCGNKVKNNSKARFSYLLNEERNKLNGNNSLHISNYYDC